jgi:hypothetical protein
MSSLTTIRVVCFVVLILLTNYLNPVGLHPSGVFYYLPRDGGWFIPNGALQFLLGILPRIASSVYTDNFNVCNRAIFQTAVIVQCALISFFLGKLLLNLWRKLSQ